MITTIWWSMYERWKERGAASGENQNKFRRETLLSKIGTLSKEEGHMPLRCRFLFKPVLEKLKKSTLLRIQYWVEESGGIIRQWRTKENARDKHMGGRDNIKSYFGRAQRRRVVVLRRSGRRSRVRVGSIRIWEKTRKEMIR